jgi:MoxR-like ATPase
LKGRPFVIPDDVQDVAHPVLSVRLGLAPDARNSFLDDLLASVPVPV